MKSAIFAAMVLLAGCGFHSTTTVVHEYPEPPTQPDPYFGGVVTHVIDPGASVVADPVTFGITAAADGTTFRVVWVDDGTAHEFRGILTCPQGGTWTRATFSAGYGYAQPIVNGQQVSFIATPDNITGVQGLDLSVTAQPIEFDLYIDGSRAQGAVLFTSQGVRSIPADIPFALYDAGHVFSVAAPKTSLAPQAFPMLPGKDASKQLTVTPPAQPLNVLSNSFDLLAK